MSRTTLGVVARMRATWGNEQWGQARCSTGTPAKTARGRDRDREKMIGRNAIHDGLRRGTGASHQ